MYVRWRDLLDVISKEMKLSGWRGIKCRGYGQAEDLRGFLRWEEKGSLEVHPSCPFFFFFRPAFL